MPWYSTSNYQPPAIHLHIMTNPDPEKDGLEDGSVLSLGAAAAPIPNGVSPAKEEQQHQQNCQSPPPVADDADNPNSHNHNSSNNNNNEAESDNSHIVDEVFQVI